MNKNETYRYPVALTIAGSDSGGGAGIQADIKTFSALGVFATSAITAITAQNTQGVRSIQPVSPDVLRDQIEAVLEDFTVDAIKIGMLYSAEAAHVVADTLARYPNIPIVLDPVMISTSGSKRLREDAIRTITERLFPMTTLLTPNIPEAEELSGVKIQNEEDITAAARVLRELGCRSVLVKGDASGRTPGRDPQHARHGVHALVRHRGVPGALHFFRVRRAPRKDLREQSDRERGGNRGRTRARTGQSPVPSLTPP